MEELLHIQNEVSQRLHRAQTGIKASCSATYTSYSKEHAELILANYEEFSHLKALEKHELLVCESFIHDDIAPGFRYMVKENGTNKLLLGGQAKYLERIGQGYGRRLTFETEDVLENDNFFWTDSNRGGYIFTIEAISVGDRFAAKIGKTEIGVATVTRVGLNQEIIDSVIIDKELRKRVKVEFECLMTNENCNDKLDKQISLKLQGIVTLVKRKNNAKCRLEDVKILSRSGSKVVLEPVSTT
eukprot:gene17639-9283_t